MEKNKGNTKLEKWINPLYLQEETMRAIKKACKEQEIQHIQLQDFFKQEKAETILQHCQRAHYQRRYVPDQYNYAVADKLGVVATVQEVFADPLMRAWLEEITEKRNAVNSINILRFVHGDYILMHDSAAGKEGLLLIYDPGASWPREAGGYDVFTLLEKDPLLLQPQANTLTLILLTKEIRHFVKYVNSLSKEKKRYCFKITYTTSK